MPRAKKATGKVVLTQQQTGFTAEHQRMLELPISVLNLPVRTVNALENSEREPNVYGNVIQIVTLGDLLAQPVAELSAMRNMGAATLTNIFAALGRLGFLRGNVFVAPERRLLGDNLQQQERIAQKLGCDFVVSESYLEEEE